MAYYLKDLPFTEEGKKLNLSDEDRERFRLVYKKGGEDWILHDIFGEGGDYGDDCIVVPLESTYMGHTIFKPGDVFSNVVGSSGDTSPVGHSISWIAFWNCMYLATFACVPPDMCCTDGFEYIPVTNGAMTNWIQETVEKCYWNAGNNCKIIGGHVIKDSLPAEVPAGECVYIVPICGAHNSRNDGLMRIRDNTFAVQLSYRNNLYTYLAQHPLETHEKI